MESLFLLFFDKRLSTTSKITVLEKDETETDDTKIAKTFNTFCGNMIKTLNIEKNEGITCNTDEEKDPILRAIKKSTACTQLL